MTTVPKPFMVKTRSMGRRKSASVSRAGTSAARRNFALQFVKAGALERADGNHGRAADIEKRSAHEIFNLHADDVERVFVDHVGFGDHGDAARNGEQPADFEVLARLRLDGFVGGDDEQDEVDAAHAGEHVADEALVAGDVDEAEADFSAGRVKLRCAKPMSMVMPRRFSSSRRSASMPVSALTSAVLPWSMWPAVPMMMDFMNV